MKVIPIILACAITAFAADTTYMNSDWTVGTYYLKNPITQKNCIILQASMRISIEYDTKENKTETADVYTPPQGNTTGQMRLNPANSSCFVTEWPPSGPNTPPNTNIATNFQRIEFTFWEDWKLGLVFCNNGSIVNFGKFGDKAFVLYSVDLQANLNRVPNSFENITEDDTNLYASTNVTANANDNYWRQVSVKGVNTTFKCRHLRNIKVTDKVTLGLVNLTMIAFADVTEMGGAGAEKTEEDNCPQRIPMDKPIDIIIGAIMSVCISIVMLIYPIYRYKAGPSKIPKHLMPQPPKQSVSSVDGHHLSVGTSNDKM